MNVAHKALQNNWIYLIFFSVVSQLKVIANCCVRVALYQLFPFFFFQFTLQLA